MKFIKKVERIYHKEDPFLVESVANVTNVINAAADKKNYPLSHEIFRMKLPGDEQ